jgi:hypothetical protein
MRVADKVHVGSGTTVKHGVLIPCRRRHCGDWIQTKGLRPINLKPAASASCMCWGKAAKLFQIGSSILPLSGLRQSDMIRRSGASRKMSASEFDTHERSAS